jgi:hypothetical protein
VDLYVGQAADVARRWSLHEQAMPILHFAASSIPGADHSVRDVNTFTTGDEVHLASPGAYGVSAGTMVSAEHQLARAATLRGQKMTGQFDKERPAMGTCVRKPTHSLMRVLV